MMAIAGGSLGAFVVTNQPRVLKATMSALPKLLKASKYTKARYMEMMALLYDILQKARKEGLMSIENDVEAPHESPLFQKYPTVGSDHHVVEFMTDYLRMMVSGNLNAHEIESLMDNEIETHHDEAHAPAAAIQRLAGALPAFGIVAAVLGVVNTMGSVGQPPAILGGMIGSALVGTFLGILLAYAVVEPLAGLMEQKVDEALEGAAVHQGHAAREHAGLRAAGRRRVRSQGAVLDRAADVRRTRKPRQREEGSRDMAGDSKKLQPIIVKRVKRGGHAAHGGAWKIAYADFVTAMMAFFLLMWLLGSTTEGDRKGIADYFQSPLKVALLNSGSGSGDSSSVVKGGGTDLTRSRGQVKRGEIEAKRSTINLPGAEAGGAAGRGRRACRRCSRRCDEIVADNPRLAAMSSQIRLDMTPDGLRIQIVDEQSRAMFDSGSAVVKPYMQRAAARDCAGAGRRCRTA